VDKELSAPNVVAEVAPVAAAAGAAEPAAVAAPVTYAAKPPAATGGWVPAEARPLLVGAAGGGLLTLLGVWLGHRLGRRS
jgi:hypothetical protein